MATIEEDLDWKPPTLQRLLPRVQDGRPTNRIQPHEDTVPMVRDTRTCYLLHVVSVFLLGNGHVLVHWKKRRVVNGRLADISS